VIERPLVEIDTVHNPPKCSILGEDGTPIIMCYGRTGEAAIHKMQEFVAMMRRDKAGIKK